MECSKQEILCLTSVQAMVIQRPSVSFRESWHQSQSSCTLVCNCLRMAVQAARSISKGHKRGTLKVSHCHTCMQAELSIMYAGSLGDVLCHHLYTLWTFHSNLITLTTPGRQVLPRLFYKQNWSLPRFLLVHEMQIAARKVKIQTQLSYLKPIAFKPLWYLPQKHYLFIII